MTAPAADTIDTDIPEAAAVRATVVAYLAAVASGTAADIAALYAEGGTLEDPVGTTPKVGRAAAEEFYRPLEASERATELLTLRISGASAAFHFRVETKAGDKTYVITPIDVMTFDKDARITSMRAFWAPSDMQVR